MSHADQEVGLSRKWLPNLYQSLIDYVANDMNFINNKIINNKMNGWIITEADYVGRRPGRSKPSVCLSVCLFICLSAA